MPSKKAKQAIQSDNVEDRALSYAATAARPTWQTVGIWIAIAVGGLWCGMYLLTPQWPPDMLAADADTNGPRWLMLLAPDAILDGWVSGRVSLAGLAERCMVLAPALIVWLVAWFAGRLVLNAAAPLKSPTRWERAILAVVVGLSLHSLVVLVVGLAGAVGRGWSGPLIAGLTLAVAYGIRWLSLPARATEPFPDRADLAKQAQRVAVGSGPQPTTWALRLGGVAVVALAAFIIVRSMMPPAEYDVREYHLQAPKEWSQAGQISFLPHNIYTSMPMGAEMHVIATIDWWRVGRAADAWWWGALSGKVVIAGFAILAAGLAGCSVCRVTDSTAGIWTTAVALTMPAMIEGATLGLIEAAVGCFFAAGLLVVVAVLKHQAPAGKLPYVWVGFFAGSALACKYPALVFVVLPLGIACWFWDPTASTSTRLRGVAWFALAAAVAGGPWMTKNAVLTGNPVYPLAANVFGGRTMDEAKIAQWNRGHATGDFSIAEVGIAAERLSWKWKSQSLLLVPLGLLAVIGRWDRHETRYAALGIAISILLWWLQTHRIARFLVPSLPLLFVLAGIGWQVLREQIGLRGAVGIAAFGVLLNGLMIGGPLIGDVRVAVDLSALRTDRTSDGGVSRLAEHVRYVNDRLDANDHLLLVGEAMAFDFIPQVTYSTTFDQSPLTAITTNRPVQQWQEAFAEQGWTHVLVHWGEIERLRSTYGFDERITPELLQRLQQAGVIEKLRPGLTGGAVDLYKVK